MTRPTSSSSCPTRDADAILIRMRPSEAAEIRELSVYPPDTAGGIMTPAFVAVARDAVSPGGDRRDPATWSTRPRR